MKLKRKFYNRDTITVAKGLLGKTLVHRTKDGIVKGKIVEVEAYLGKADAACHSYKGDPGGRTNVLYNEGGYAYIYLIYGMYYCLNIVSNKKNEPEAILIRAVEPIEGIEIMFKNRVKAKNIKNLCNGPGKICLAFDINKDNYGMDLCGDTLYIEEGEAVSEENIVTTPRINIDYSGEAKDYLYRFLMQGNPYVSKNKGVSNE